MVPASDPRARHCGSLGGSAERRSCVVEKSCRGPCMPAGLRRHRGARRRTHHPAPSVPAADDGRGGAVVLQRAHDARRAAGRPHGLPRRRDARAVPGALPRQGNAEGRRPAGGAAHAGEGGRRGSRHGNGRARQWPKAARAGARHRSGAGQVRSHRRTAGQRRQHDRVGKLYAHEDRHAREGASLPEGRDRYSRACAGPHARRRLADQHGRAHAEGHAGELRRPRAAGERQVRARAVHRARDVDAARLREMGGRGFPREIRQGRAAGIPPRPIRRRSRAAGQAAHRGAGRRADHRLGRHAAVDGEHEGLRRNRKGLAGQERRRALRR